MDHHQRVPRLLLAFVVFRFPALVVFRWRATAMLSTRFGYLRPAARARARASLFCAGVSPLVRFFGLFRVQGGRESERDAINNLSGAISDGSTERTVADGISSCSRPVKSEPSCFTSLL
jgi:hypothetical protein